ncbi:VPLPA-CTERM sorting domain-containing protein [Lutimaribacter saemankumensis]|uniref:VPLPA-CTERM protein sorting domain-containing protein n=1 Tax=Lutimaribacter saemankumensis TaxID=490829 RepID=A0A1G8HYQ4_9RHOB|nr:VPLPA-CTERM sorting domain-containing protein [Lutimaribacter saemankumensis]SDI11796.1 VPLPA-CTERM protein sorting domain-containing protein [Lutimaribacter saemankumensis]
MKLKSLVAAALLIAPVGANATPLHLEYSVEAQGAGYAYNFLLTADNNDGSLNLGDTFDWFIIGDANSTASPFSEGATFFTSVPSGWLATSSGGAHNGPTLGFGANVTEPGWAPSVGESISFSGFSTTYLGEGSLLWSNLVGTGTKANFVAASLAAVPVPAALPLLITCFGGLGFIARRKRKAA